MISQTSLHLEIADLIGRGAAAQNPECWDLAVKESSDSEPRRGAGEAEGEGGGWVQKKLRPEVNCFLFALCKGACFSEL